MNPPVNGKIQGLFKAFECFSSTFQGKFNFEDSPVYSSTFQACANLGSFEQPNPMFKWTDEKKHIFKP